MSKSEGQVLDFEKICRLCLLEKRSMSSIFAKKKSDKKVPLPVRIMSCASLELYEGDGLPASICSKCLLSVNQSYAFREQCEQADTTLRQYAQRMNDASGETSSNRESRELIANDSLAHIEDFGIKIEERQGDEEEDDFEQGGNLDLNNWNVAISVVGNVQNSRKGLNESKKCSFKGNESVFECRVKEIVSHGEHKSCCIKDKGSLMETSLKNPLHKGGECELKRSESEEQSGINEKSKKMKVEESNGNIGLGSDKSASFDSPILKALFEKKAENLVVIADVPVVLEDEDCDFGESGSEDNESLTRVRTPLRFEGVKTRDKNLVLPQAPARDKPSEGNSPRKSGFGNKKHLELLQNLMKNKNIVVKKRGACLPSELFTGKMSDLKDEFSKSVHRKRRLSFPYDFKIAQLWKEWEEVNKRIPKISETKQALSEINEEAVLAGDFAFSQNSGKSCVLVENAKEEKSVESPKGKCKNTKDTVYCKECRIFLLRSSYSNHIKFVHKKIRKYLCQTCGYAACTGTILRQHVQAVHVGYSFFCDQCPKKFNLMKRLRKHIELHHSGKPIERNHICQYCGMAFVKPGCLKRHLRSHTQETPYQCQYCQRQFKYRWPKKQHERLHTGEKPYKCSFCEERFTQNCVRKVHEYKKHGNEEFKPKARTKEGSAASGDTFRSEKEDSEVSRESCNSDESSQ